MPTRTIAGQKTLLARTMHDIRYDAVHDELLVTNPFAQAVLTFRGGASGEESPIRIIQGPKTMLEVPDRLEVDPVHNEIFVPEGGDSILVYPREGNGNVAPIRVIRGPDTGLKGIRSLAVDPVHDLIVAGTSYRAGLGGPPGSLVIFNRTDNGNVKPRAVIKGPKSGIVRIQQFRVYPPKGWIIAAQLGGEGVAPENSFVGVWSINDNGDVPPRWKIGGPKSMLKKPRGIALDPKYKELIVADMRLNSILVYYFPEIF